MYARRWARHIGRMTETTHPALAPSPSQISIGAVRERFSVAFAVFGAQLDESGRIAVATALAKQSPVDAVVSLYSALLDNDEAGAPRWLSLGPELLSRAIEAADLIVAHLWHGKEEEAAAFAAEARAALAAMPDV